MAASMIDRRSSSGVGKRAQRGFSMLEVIVSMAVLTTGLVSLLGVFGLAMASTQTSQQDMIAKQLANESLESIVTARNTSQLTWDAIQNVGDGDGNGVFLAGFNPIYQAGLDGIYGTTDDLSQPLQQLQDPGPDGVFGTSDDAYVPLNGYQRQVLIQSALDGNNNPIGTLRQITITVKYAATQSGLTKTYTLTSLISQFR